MNVFSALAEPTRLRIVELLASHGELPVGAITRHFRISAPGISQHLKVLRDVKLVAAKIHGQQRLYSVNPQGLAQIEGWAKTLQNYGDSRFDALEELLLQEIVRNKKPARKRKTA